jgi:eukaryotic-like serine/threonine-protein kinase
MFPVRHDPISFAIGSGRGHKLAIEGGLSVLGRMWGRFHGWWLLTAVASASAVVGLLAPSLPVLAGSLLVGAVGGLGGVLTVRAQRAIDRGDGAQGIIHRRLVRVRDVDNPLAVGVHAALPPGAGEQAMPPFVTRDQSAALADALGENRFVLVVGEPTAGKSRMAYEAMRSALPGYLFIQPAGKQDLPGALQLAGQHRRSAIWLDDLERYLGVDGLTAGMLSPLLAAHARHTVILATMRAHQRARYSPRQASGVRCGEGHELRLAGQVLALAHEVRVERLWSRAEQDRAAALKDGRILRALQHADEFGVTQYLAAAPQLFREWRDAQGSAPEGRPRGVALVAAAVDTRRAGYQQPLSLEVLRELHECYLTDAAAQHIRLESWEEALLWATGPLQSTSSLLLPAGDDRYIAFDFLADAVDESEPARQLPAAVWDKLVDFVPAEDVIEVAWSAFLRSRPLIAERALQKAFEAGHYEAALDFASMMNDSEHQEQVITWLQQAVASAAKTGIAPEQVLKMRHQLAWWLGARRGGEGDPDQARRLALGVVEDNTSLLGAKHPQTLASRLTLARQIGALGDTGAALAIATDVADTAAHLSGDDSWVSMEARFEIAVWTRIGGDPRAAIALWQNLVTDQVAAGDPGFLDELGNIVGAVNEIADPALDARVLGWLEDLFCRAGKPGMRADVYVQLGHALAWWAGGRGDGPGDHEHARDIAQDVIETGTRMLGPDHYDVLTAQLILARQYGRLGDTARALAISRETAETCVRVYGPAKRVTQEAYQEISLWEQAGQPSSTAPGTRSPTN